MGKRIVIVLTGFLACVGCSSVLSVPDNCAPTTYGELSADELQQVKESLLSGIAMLVDNPYAIVKTKKVQMDGQKPLVLNHVVYVPVNFISKSFGHSVENISSEKMLNGQRYAPARATAAAVGKKLFYDERGLIIIADDVSLYQNEVPLNLNSRRKFANEVANRITFDRPSVSDIRNDFLKTAAGGTHPRLLLTPARVARIKTLIETDATAKSYYDSIFKTADDLLNAPALAKLDRATIHNRIKVLGLMYQLTGNRKYGDCAWQYMEFQCNAPGWMPIEPFDLAYLSKGIANAYDLFYDYMTPDQRAFVRNAMVAKGLNLYAGAYEKACPEKDNLLHLTIKTNHNVSQNCGAIMLALALMDEPGLSDQCAEVVSCAMTAMENYLPEFLMFGSSKEGVYYWYWPMQSLLEIINCLDHTLGHDYGLTQIPGMSSSGLFPVYMTGPTGMAFNWGNAFPKFYISSEVFWLAKQFGTPELSSFRINAIRNGLVEVNPYDLLYYEPLPADCGGQLPKAEMFRGTESAGLFSSMDDPNAFYIGIKGGYNNAIHTSLSAGSFVLDALGERWGYLIGQENYSVPHYWDYSVNGTRWTYYRMRAEGQNAMVLNPSDKPDQYPTAYSRIEKYDTGAPGSFAVVNATPAFAEDSRIQSAMRGAFVGENRAVIQDDVKAQNSTYYFMMQTHADISVSDDKKSAILTLNGKQLAARLQSTDDCAGFSVMNAEPLPTSPNPAENSINIGIRKLIVQLDNISNLTVKVSFEPSEAEPARRPVIKLDHWGLSEDMLP